MSRFVLVLIVLGVVFLALSAGEGVSAQDCERVTPGNAQSPCKRLDYLDGIQPPNFLVSRFTTNQGGYICRGYLEFRSSTPLRDHSEITVAGSRTYAEEVYDNCRNCWSLYDRVGRNEYRPSSRPILVDDRVVNRVLALVGPRVSLSSPVEQDVDVYPYLVVAVRFGGYREEVNYVVVSDTFERPKEVADYRLLMNQCLAGITRQLEHEAGLEAARKQAEEDKVRAETAAEEAQNKAEIAAIELQSAQDALQAQETLNVALLQETILSVKREDAIRAAWQQVILVRMAGLEERTEIWGEAVNRWAEEDLQFSTAMEARIQEVERLQTLNAALEQSMADQRRLLIARLKDLEEAEQEALETRTPTN